MIHLTILTIYPSIHSHVSLLQIHDLIIKPVGEPMWRSKPSTRSSPFLYLWYKLLLRPIQ